MSESLWVFLGGALGAAALLELLRRRPGRLTVMVVSVVTSLLLGAFYAGVRESAGLGAFVGLGLLATAASFVVAGGECHEVPTTVSDALQLLRRVCSLMALQATLSAAFAAVGFLSINSAIVLYLKTT